MISKILSTAVKLYLRSQVEGAESLKVKIIGGNKQILTGYIPQVSLSCSHAVYQGLYLNRVELRGANIAFNLPEVLKRQPLKLTEPVFVDLEVKLSAADLQASVNSPLLQSGIKDLLRMIATQGRSNNSVIEWITIAIANQKLNLTGIYRDAAGIGQLSLSTGISLVDSHTLCLSPLKVNLESSTDEIKNELKIDLGTDVAIEQLVIESEQILCAGKIRINS